MHFHNCAVRNPLPTIPLHTQPIRQSGTCDSRSKSHSCNQRVGYIGSSANAYTVLANSPTWRQACKQREKNTGEKNATHWVCTAAVSPHHASPLSRPEILRPPLLRVLPQRPVRAANKTQRARWCVLCGRGMSRGSPPDCVTRLHGLQTPHPHHRTQREPRSAASSTAASVDTLSRR